MCTESLRRFELHSETGYWGQVAVIINLKGK